MGRIEQANKFKKQKVIFSLKEASGKTKHFEGLINLTHSKITGNWNYEDQNKTRRFEFRLDKPIVEGQIQIH